jgi:hypothetical protein
MENREGARVQLDAAAALYREMDMSYRLEKTQAEVASLG